MSPKLSLIAVALAFTAVLQSVDASFNLTTAIRGVYYSKVAYCYTEHIAIWNCSACPRFPDMKNVTAAVDEDHDAAAWTGYNAARNEIVVAFRGTLNIQGWVVDLDFPQIPFAPVASNRTCKGCKVHQGFMWAWQRLAPTILPAARRLAAAYPAADLLVTGHSQGAGLAGLAYADIVHDLPIKGSQRLYNYGSPRIGNPPFVLWLEEVHEPHKEHFRCTNFGDPVVHLPPTFWDQWGGFWGDWLHIPREVFFTNPFAEPQTDFRICKGNATREDPTCADSTPWYDMIGFENHTTYLGIGLGCFLE
jgi:hypothetical protein